MVARLIAPLVLLALALGPLPAGAQAQRQDEPAGVVAAPVPPSSDPTVEPPVDHREQMRLFVERIAAFARGRRPDFIVVARNGLELISKAEDGAAPASAPATRYLRTIDGILIDPITSVPTGAGGATPESRRAETSALLAIVRDHGRRVLAIDPDGSTEPAGPIPGPVDAQGRSIAQPSSLAGHPPHENPTSVLSLKDARNFLSVGNAAAFGREDEFAFALHQTNHDLVAVDPFHGRRPLGERAVETLKYKKLGARRLVLARLDIGAAASYLFYWQPAWNELPPPWIGEAVEGDPDRYRVEYWRPEWQEIITGTPKSFVAGLVEQGYDGVVLDGIDAWRYFDGEMTPPAPSL